MQNAEKKLYSYKGAVLLFDRVTAQNWTARTAAVSEKKAISNLIYRFKTENGLAPIAKITLASKPTLIEEEEIA